MKTNEIVELGLKLGLHFDEKRTFPDLLARNYVVFDGCNNQRFSIDGDKLTDDEIYAQMGEFLKSYGRRQKCMQISNVLDITSDYYD